MKLKLTLALLLVGATCATSANANGYRAIRDNKVDVSTQEYINCMDNSGGVTSVMLECTAKEHEYWDKELNKAYNKAMQACNAYFAQDVKKAQECKSNLKNMERNWLKYRSLVNKLPADVFADGNGTLTLIIESSRNLRMVQDQTLLLRSIYQGGK